MRTELVDAASRSRGCTGTDWDPLAGSRRPGDPELDLLLTGMVFFDVVFTGLPDAPAPGTEVWARGMGSSPGGIANLAVAASRLGLRTGLAAGFGDDLYADWCWKTLSGQEGIDLAPSRRYPGWHTPVTVSMALNNDRSMVTHGHPVPEAAELILASPPRSRAVMIDLVDGSESERAGATGPPWWQRSEDAGALVFADVGWDPTGRWDRSVLDGLAGAHAFVPNCVEAMAYTSTETPEDALRSLAPLVPLAVVTCGSDGVVAIDSSTGEEARCDALSVEAIDATGAGDVFGAGLVVGTLAGWPLDQRLLFSSLCSALAVQQFGGSLAAPGWGDIADWWNAVQVRARDGDSYSREVSRNYGFLSDLLPPGPVIGVRRAEATIARFSDP